MTTCPACAWPFEVIVPTLHDDRVAKAGSVLCCEHCQALSILDIAGNARPLTDDEATAYAKGAPLRAALDALLAAKGVPHR